MKPGTLLVATLLTLAAPAHANPKLHANRIYKEGNALYKAGDFSGALARYRAAQKLHPHYKIAYNIAQTLDELKRLPRAATYFEYFLTSAGKAAPGPMRRAAAKRLGELRVLLLSVQIRCSEAGATVQVDGRPAGRTPLAHSLYLTPGRHQLVVAKEGFVSWKQKVQGSAGARSELTAELKRLAPRRVALPPAAPGPVTARQDTPHAADPGSPDAPAGAISPVPSGQDQLGDVQARRRSKTILAYSSLGVGAALAITAAILYGVGSSQGSEAHDNYMAAADEEPPKNPDDVEQYRADIDSARGLVIAGHVLIGVAALATGFSIYNFVTRPAAQRHTALSGGPLSVQLSREGTTTISFQGRF